MSTISMAEAGDSSDFLSRLPEPLRHRVLSFLPKKDIANTSLLSKSWLETWRSRAILEISDLEFYTKQQPQEERVIIRSDSPEEERIRSQEFRDYIESTLRLYQARGTCLDTFKLNISCAEHDRNYLVKECTELALKYGVRNFHLETELDIRLQLGYVDLPSIVLQAECLVSLHIGNYSKLPVDYEIKCHRLKRLSLHLARLNHVMLQKLLLSCPLLEQLDIKYCGEVLVDLRIVNAFNPKVFTLGGKILCEYS